MERLAYTDPFAFLANRKYMKLFDRCLDRRENRRRKCLYVKAALILPFEIH